MSYVKHDVVVAIGWRNETAVAVRAFADTLPDGLKDIILISSLRTNATVTFCWASDGSKEGWDTSKLADEWRERFVQLLNEHKCDVLTARFGGDDRRSYDINVNGVYSSHSEG